MHSAVNKIKALILNHGYPFAVEGDRLRNVITHAYVPVEFVEQILNTGQKMYENYDTERINGNLSLWAKMTKVGNKMFMPGNKTTPIKLRDKTVSLKETNYLYGILMILAKSRDIDKNVTLEIMNLPLHRGHCFTLHDGSMLRCTDKSMWIRLLEMLRKETELGQGRLPSEETGCVYDG